MAGSTDGCYPRVIRFAATLLLAPPLTGCVSSTLCEDRMHAFVQRLPATTGFDGVTRVFVSPFYMEFDSAKNVSHRPDGQIHIGSAKVTVLSWLYFGRVTVDDLRQKPLAPAPKPPLREDPEKPRVKVEREVKHAAEPPHLGDLPYNAEMRKAMRPAAP